LKEKIRETYKQYNTLNREVVVKSFKAQYVACKGCGSKLHKEHLNSNLCPLCRTDMRSETTQNKIKALYQKWQDLQVELRKEEETLATQKGVKKWLVKFEYHI
jgi:transcription initiation factor IIE alpha subunit